MPQTVAIFMDKTDATADGVVLLPPDRGAHIARLDATSDSRNTPTIPVPFATVVCSSLEVPGGARGQFLPQRYDLFR